MKKLIQSVAIFALFAGTAYALPNLGNSTPGSTADTGSGASYIVGTPFQASATGTYTTANVYCSSSGSPSTLILGVYNYAGSGTPSGTLVATSAPMTCGTSAGWQSAAITAPVVSGNWYLLMTSGSSAGTSAYYSSSGTAYFSAMSYTGSFVDPFPAGGESFTGTYSSYLSDSSVTAEAPTYSPPGSVYAGPQSVTISTTSPGAIICYNLTGAPATDGATGCAAGSFLFTTPLTVSTNTSIWAVAGGTGYLDSGASPANYIIAGHRTWFIRTDGGTRYDASLNPTGQCDGLGDVAYPGSGTNQHCAFNDARLIYNLMTGTNITNWAIIGGDTVVFRFKAGGWRIGGDGPSGPYNACDNSNYWACSIPPPPSGTSSFPTRFMSGCAYDGVCTQVPDSYPLPSNNWTEIFGGYASNIVFWLGGAQYVDFEGLHITEHNATDVAAHAAYSSGTTYAQNDSVSSAGAVYVSLVGSNIGNTPASSPTFWMLAPQCTTRGAPSAPAAYCKSGSSPVDDFAKYGIVTNGMAGSSGAGNVTMTDVVLDGFTESGIGGPIAGPWTLNRVILGFNTFAGWNFDDGADTADGAGSSITANHLAVIGNGFLKEYPVVHASFPALAGWDAISGGFGDGLSGQDTILDSFVCHHCNLFYNTKDAFIGPHTQITNLDIQNSTDAGNMGSEWKWASSLGATVNFQNNLVVENCTRLAEALPGSAQNFALSTGLPGSYLSNFCRAGGESINFLERLGNTFNFSGNTIISADTIMVAFGCGYYTPGNTFNLETDCGSNPANVYKDNNFIGYRVPNQGGVAPAQWYQDPTATYITYSSTFNNVFGFRGSGTPNPDTCGVNNITCVNPLMASQPADPIISEASLDAYNASGGTGNSFYPTMASPLVGAGTTLGGLTTDYYGTTRPSPPSMGGVEVTGSSGVLQLGGGVILGGSVVVQ